MLFHTCEDSVLDKSFLVASFTLITSSGGIEVYVWRGNGDIDKLIMNRQIGPTTYSNDLSLVLLPKAANSAWQENRNLSGNPILFHFKLNAHSLSVNSTYNMIRTTLSNWGFMGFPRATQIVPFTHREASTGIAAPLCSLFFAFFLLGFPTGLSDSPLICAELTMGFFFLLQTKGIFFISEIKAIYIIIFTYRLCSLLSVGSILDHKQ